MNYSIKYVANVTGLSEHRIRAWEKRYQLLTPSRSAKGRRLYNDEDIHKLGLIKKLINDGEKIGSLCSLTVAELQFKSQDFTSATNTAHRVGRKLDSTEKMLKQFILKESLLGQRLDVLIHEMQRPEDISVSSYLDTILVPFAGEVKKLGHEGKISKSTETLVKRFIAKQLKNEFYSLQGDQKNAPEKLDIIVATMDKNSTQIDSWVCALRSLLSGASVFHLGSIQHPEVLRDMVKVLKPRKIILTDKVDGPTASLSAQEILDEVFPTRANLPYCPLPKEDFIWDADDTEILLLLQGPQTQKVGKLESFQGLKLFSNLETMNKHLLNNKEALGRPA